MSISQILDEQELRTIYDRTLISDDVLGAPFVDGLVSICVFFPTRSYRLTETQFCALRAVTEPLDCYVLEIEESIFPGKGRHWRLTNSSYEEYMSHAFGFALHTAYIDAQARWAVVIGDDQFGRVGVTPALCQDFLHAYPQAEAQMQGLERMWRNYDNHDEMVNLLAGISENQRQYGVRSSSS